MLSPIAKFPQTQLKYCGGNNQLSHQYCMLPCASGAVMPWGASGLHSVPARWSLREELESYDVRSVAVYLWYQQCSRTFFYQPETSAHQI